jgi:hypothetical protein
MPNAKAWNRHILLNKTVTDLLCTAVYGFWPAEVLAELADERTGCGEMARGGCSFAWNFSMASSALFTKAERRH